MMMHVDEGELVGGGEMVGSQDSCWGTHCMGQGGQFTVTWLYSN